MKIFIAFLGTLALILGLISACNAGSGSTAVRTEFALGTFVTVRIDGMGTKAADAAFDAAFARLREIERIASATDPASELFRLNQTAYQSDTNVGAELFSLLKTGRFYAELTDGNFDITLGRIVELWGIGGENPRVPQADELAEAVENSGFEWLLLDENALTVRFLKPLKLDLGAIAKGYAADEMKRVLLENGVTNAILDLGGDIITIGSNKNRGWRVGLSDPFDPDPAKTCAIVTIADQTIVTSGNYERYFIHENTHYHHIFNRTTGFPAESGLVSATVIADNSATADILSTAFFVMGTEKAAKFAEKFSSEFAEIAYIFIDSDMNFTYSEGLELELELVN